MNAHGSLWLWDQAITQNPFNRPACEIGPREDHLVTLLTGGGDARITLNADTGLNKYLSAPYPRDVIAYSSSTVSDISAKAFAHVGGIDCAQDYGDWLASLSNRIRSAYSVGEDADLVFAPSGTDLEYVALAAVLGKGVCGVHNILLGADEIGSGCVHSAVGRYFAGETALGRKTVPGTDVEGLGPVTMVDVPVRCGAGMAKDGTAIVAAMGQEIEAAVAAGKHCLVHGVHGSKTGLVLPGLSEIDALQAQFGGAVTFVIDACQARITSEAIEEYLSRGAIVLMTGSKFIGAPPFNGWAMVPRDLVVQAAPLPKGFRTIFRRAEWPMGWAGQDILPDTANPSLALRLEAAMFELDRFQRIPMDQVEAIIAAFETALWTGLIKPLGVSRVNAGDIDDFVEQALPIEMRTLATLNVSGLPGLATFDEAQEVHRRLALNGIRLGQPVKCVARESGWGGTLRIGFSMPQLSEWATLPISEVQALIEADMRQITDVLQEILALQTG